MNSSLSTGARTALAWLWVLSVGAYMIWGGIGEQGLYQWLADLQVEHWGGYSPKLTALVPVLILAAPALGFLRRRDLEIREAGPVELALRTRRNAWLFVFAGIAAACVAAGTWWLSASVPDANSPATPVDFAALARSELPEGRVTLRGQVDPEVGAAIETREGPNIRTTYYVGFRIEGEPKGAPIRLFIERTAIGNVAATSQAFMADQDGFLERDGLPPLALEELAGQGVQLADVHYVLLTGSDSPRNTYYIVAALAGLIGFGSLVVGLAGLIQASTRLRKSSF